MGKNSALQPECLAQASTNHTVPAKAGQDSAAGYPICPITGFSYRLKQHTDNDVEAV